MANACKLFMLSLAEYRMEGLVDNKSFSKGALQTSHTLALYVAVQVSAQQSNVRAKKHSRNLSCTFPPLILSASLLPKTYSCCLFPSAAWSIYLSFMTGDWNPCLIMSLLKKTHPDNRAPVRPFPFIPLLNTPEHLSMSTSICFSFSLNTVLLGKLTNTVVLTQTPSKSSAWSLWDEIKWWTGA